MKKPYLRSAIATLGFFAGTLLVEAQSGGGAAGGGGTAAGGSGAAAGAATGAAIGGTSGTGAAASGDAATAITTPGNPGGTAVRGASGANTAGRANPPGTLNTIGGSSVIEANPNTLGGSVNNGGITAQAAPGTAQGAQTAAQANSLPAGVQNTLGAFAANGALGSVTAVPGQPGTFRATVTRNGVPMEITVGSNGQVLSQAPVTGTPGTAATGAINGQNQGLNTTTTPFGTANSPFVAGAVLPPTAVVMDELPNSIQEAVRAQLGEAQARGIMQQRTAAGVNYLVSYDENGRPMTLVVGPDGRIISNGPTNPRSATATATAGTDRTTNATRDVSMTLDELPNDVSDVLKQTAPYAEVRTVTREQRVGGDVYVIAVRDGDRAGELTIDDEGKVIRDTRRDLSVLSPKAPVDVDKPEGMPLDSLPVAIKNAIKAYAASSDIRSITLGSDRDGRTVFDVIFYRDGRRDRMIVRKDGTLVRIEENVSPVFDLASTKPSVLAIGDLPQEVQDTIRRQTDNVMIEQIGTKEVANQTVYNVQWKTNGTPVELLVSRDGTIILPEGDSESENANAAVVPSLDREEGAVVRIVNDTPGAARANADVGAAASTESGVSVSGSASTGSETLSAETENRPPSAVRLNEAPQAVQDTAKKIAGAGIIQSVSPKFEDNGVIYQVRYLDNNQSRTVEIDRSGKVIPESTVSEP